MLALVGALIVLLCVYFELSSLDLRRQRIADYLFLDLRLWEWWSAIGIPMFVGVVYILAAMFGMRAHLDRQGSLILLGICFVVSIALSFVSGFGYLAAALIAMCLVWAWHKNAKKEKK